MTRLPLGCPPISSAISPEVGVFRRRRAAFTLIETALALGIVAFALVPLVALLPIGMQSSRNATDLTMSAQIAQRLSGMIAQDDYSDLANLQMGNSTLEKNYYYFDSEGQPLTTTGTAVPASALYTASIIAATPTTTGNSLVNPNTVATLNLQIVNDPAHILAAANTPSATPPPALQSRAVIIPAYFGGTGG